MNRLPTQPNLTPRSLYNPSLEVFTFVYDKKEYVLLPHAIESFPTYLAQRMANSLADWIISNRGVIKNYTLDKEELLKEIYR